MNTSTMPNKAVEDDGDKRISLGLRALSRELPDTASGSITQFSAPPAPSRLPRSRFPHRASPLTFAKENLMIVTVKEFQERLNALDPYTDEFVLQADNLIEDLSPEIADSVFPAIFAFFEAAPDADCGAPGTLVHHVEHYFPNYVAALKESVKRMPSYNGVLMINRILNSKLSESERSDYMSILISTARSSIAPPEVSDMAGRFIQRRTKIDSEQGGGGRR